MIKGIFIFHCFSILIFLLIGISSYSQNEKSIDYIQEETNLPNKEFADSTPILEFDSLLVIHFHPTAQCSCCINVGNFAKKGLEKFYSKLYKDRRIIFREHNIDEDSFTAKKYKIFWSALGFQICSEENNRFKEIESVWQFCEDKDVFLLNFKKELDEFISEEKEGKIQPKIQERDT